MTNCIHCGGTSEWVDGSPCSYCYFIVDAPGVKGFIRKAREAGQDAFGVANDPEWPHPMIGDRAYVFNETVNSALMAMYDAVLAIQNFDGKISQAQALEIIAAIIEEGGIPSKHPSHDLDLYERVRIRVHG